MFDIQISLKIYVFKDPAKNGAKGVHTVHLGVLVCHASSLSCRRKAYWVQMKLQGKKKQTQSNCRTDGN